MEQKIIKENMEEVLSSAFLEYAGYNLQRRAIPDARDGLKWGARQLLHAQSLGKFTHDKPFKKAIKSVSQAMGFSYVHGDASAYGTFIRMAKPFVMNIPLQEANGNFGTLINPDDHSAARYVELRGSEAAAYLLKDLDKETVTEWEDTYDLEGQFPKVLPAKGFWGLTNGCLSIGSGMSCSIPPFNLKELNTAFIDLLWDENKTINLLPDFPTGATILNEKEVLESLKCGSGRACKIRATIEYDSAERCLIVKEMPYSTYTNTICSELAALLEKDENCGIKDFVDYTGQSPDLRIYLTKKANVDKVLRLLYKETSLQTFYSINMTVLKDGERPEVMGLKDLMLEHLKHEKTVYIRGFGFDLCKIKNRLHIIEGLIKAYNMIDKAVETIKQSPSSAAANKALQDLLEIDDAQAKAILGLKLARLSKLDITKLKNEQSTLENEKNHIEEILNDDDLLKKEIEKGFQEVIKKFSTSRRTKVLNIEGAENEPTEIRTFVFNLTNENNLYVSESSSLYTQRRGGVGTKLKLEKGEFVVSSLVADTTDTILFFSNKGTCYHAKAEEIALNEKIFLQEVIPIKDYERICAMTTFNKSMESENIIIFTKQGFMKKSLMSTYNTTRAGGLKAIDLSPNDEICSVLLVNNERVGLLTAKGQLLICKTGDVRPIGRVAKGVKGIKLSDGDYVVAVKIIPKNIDEILTVTQKGYAKRTKVSECNTANRYTKGIKIHKLKDEEDELVNFLPILNEKTITFVSSRAQLRTKLKEVPLLGKGTQGIHSTKLKDNEKIIGLLSL